MTAEMHISSLVVQCRPEHLEAVSDRLRSLPGTELHGASPQGRLVVVLETAGQAEISSWLAAVRDLPDILNAALVYHAVDGEDAKGGQDP
jgi:periplasmic nitrate reductase NapD